MHENRTVLLGLRLAMSEYRLLFALKTACLTKKRLMVVRISGNGRFWSHVSVYVAENEAVNGTNICFAF